MKARRDYLNLMAVANIYLFAQLFFTPLLVGLFAHPELVRVVESELYFPMATMFTVESVAISVLGYISFLIGGRFRLPLVTSGTHEIDWHAPNVVRVFWIFFVFGFVWKILRFLHGGSFQISGAEVGVFGDVVTFFLSLNWFHVIALPFLAIAYYENKASHQCIARYYPFVLSFYLINGLINGAVSFFIFPLLMHLAIRQRYQKIEFSWIFVFGLIIILVVYFKVFMKAFLLGDPENVVTIFAPLTILVNRISTSFVVASITNDPDFSYGYGIVEQFMYSMRVPGFEYAVPDGNGLGHAYSLIAIDDFRTGMAISLVGDLFLHWGPIGVTTGMFLIGLLYRQVTTLTESKRRLSWIVYAALYPIMLHGLESPVSVLIAAIFKMAVLCVAFYHFGRLFLLPPRHSGEDTRIAS